MVDERVQAAADRYRTGGGAGLIAGGTQPFQGLEVDPRPSMSFPRVLFSYAAPRRSPGQGLGGGR
jgi:hypothetical protein